MRTRFGWGLLLLAVGLWGCGQGSVPTPLPGEPDAPSAPVPVEPPVQPTPPTEPTSPPVTPPSEPPKAQPFAYPPLQTELAHLEVEVSPAVLEQMYADPHERVEHPATVTVGGTRHPVTLRIRGGSSRGYPKKSWRIDFGKGVQVGGWRKHNLIAEMADRTMLVEKLAYDLLAGMGAPAPRTTFVRLSINGRFQGVYLDIERIDQAFVRAREGFEDDDATVYRCGSQDCELKPLTQKGSWQAEWEKETNEHEGREDLEAFLDRVNHTPEPELVEVLEQHLDVPSYLKVMVNDALISNEVILDSGSYWIHDRQQARWTYVPWDYNNSASRWWPTYGLEMKPIVDRPLFAFSLFDNRVASMYALRRPSAPAGYTPAFSNLTSRIARHPVLRERMLEVLERALEELFTEQATHARLEAMHALIAPYVAQDPYVNLNTEGQADQEGFAKFRKGLPYLKRYVTQRRAMLAKELVRVRGWKLQLALEAFDPRAGWVELKNHGAQAMNLRDLVLTTSLRHTIPRLRGHAPGDNVLLPERTLGSGEVVRFTASELGLSFPSKGAIGLFDGTSVIGVHDFLFYGPLGSGEHYRRSPEDPLRWEVR